MDDGSHSGKTCVVTNSWLWENGCRRRRGGYTENQHGRVFLLCLVQGDEMDERKEGTTSSTMSK